MFRDLAWTRAAYLLDRQLPEKLFKKINSLKNFNHDFIVVITKDFPNEPSFNMWLKFKLQFLTQ